MSEPSKNLETFPNPNPERDYEISFTCPEFTCLCPKTGQPDFATLKIQYIPHQKCVELKSLKLYLWSYRNKEAFHEKVANQILNNLVLALSPKEIILTADFYIRGGIHTIITVKHKK